ncbi:MAG: hypothetical protein OXK72_07665 [Gammaproteobacteria bacterium]|nr:hypothetical protein [Gammaproteobacteria bacterium]
MKYIIHYRFAISIFRIAKSEPFMAKLHKRGMPIAIHSDLGGTGEPTRCMPWTEEALRLCPDNKIITSSY